MLRIIVLFLTLAKSAISDDIVIITNEDELRDFVGNVNSGRDYSGATVYLGSDLSFSGITLEPIGKDTNNYFRGVFDGQGYIINSLTISSSSSGYTGLFGYSEGLTIRNVVLDDSCSITSSYSSSYVCIGGIIGYCESSERECSIENSVNMADVTFSENTDGNILNFGGIAGKLCASSTRYASYAKNCANYGSVTHSGTSKFSNVGGVVGVIDRIDTTYTYSKYLYNCLNYGSITHSGTTSDTLRIGGITGYGELATIENCVSAGEISTQSISQKKYIGSIVGFADSGSYINYCYYTDELIEYNFYGTGTITSSSYTLSYDNTTFELSGDVSIESYTGTSLIYALNAVSDYYAKCNSKWLLNKDSKNVNFTINGRASPITMNYQIILLPNLASKDNMLFDGWYNDSECTYPLKSFETTEDTEIYGLYNEKIRIVLDANGGNGSETLKFVTYNTSYGELPKANRTGYTFLGWFTEKSNGTEVLNTTIVTNPNGHTLYAHWTPNNYTMTFDFGNETTVNVTFTYNESIIYTDISSIAKREGYTLSWANHRELMPARDITVTAQWTPNNYTVSFDVSGGDPLSDNEATKRVTFAEKYGDLPEPTKEGYMFIGWFDEGGDNATEVTNKTTVTNPSNHTLYAHWEEIPIIKEEKDKANTSLVVGVTVPVVIVVVAAVVVALFIILKKKHDDDSNDRALRKNRKGVELNSQQREEYYRVVAASMDGTETNDASGNNQSILTNLYPQVYTIPTMRNALLEAGLTKSQAKSVCDACENVSKRALNEGKLFDNFTEDDAAAIAMYTYDFGPGNFEDNPYRIINKSLAGRNFSDLQKTSGLLYLVMSALRKLPRFTGKALYRGVRSEVNLDKDHYRNGNVITWSALSSTSPSMETTKAFLAKGSKSGKAEGTLFVIDSGWGYDIQPYSLFPDEVEILLEPERQFKVTGVIEGEGLTFINLQMLDTPLSIPEVFGAI